MSAEIVTVATSEIHVVTMGQQGPQGPVGPIGPTGGSALSVYAETGFGQQGEGGAPSTSQYWS